MNKKNSNFFIKLKNAVFNFDEYKTFAEEETSKTIKYLLKLVFIFSLIITIVLTINILRIASKELVSFDSNCPNYRFENNRLIIDEEEKQYISEYGNGYLGIVINSEKENLENIEDDVNYQRVIAFLKDKLIIKNANGLQNAISYEDLSNNYDLNSINKQSIIELFNSKNIVVFYLIFFVISIAYMFVIYFIQIIIDILL